MNMDWDVSIGGCLLFQQGIVLESELHSETSANKHIFDSTVVILEQKRCPLNGHTRKPHALLPLTCKPASSLQLLRNVQGFPDSGAVPWGNISNDVSFWHLAACVQNI